MKKILAFSGSNNSQSINNTLIQILAKKANQTTVDIIDLNDFNLPMYGIDVESRGIPADALRLRAMLNAYDALIIASPEHNGSMPAFLKNVIDWLSRIRQGAPFFGDEVKPVLLVSASPGANGGATNLKTMAKLMYHWGGDIKGSYSLGSFADKFQNGAFDTSTTAELDALMASFESAITDDIKRVSRQMAS